MKDESQHIFRSLETVGHDGFDTIVRAAVATYGSLRAPSETQARDFGRLVAAVWDKISADSRRALAAALSKSSRVPRSVVDRLLAEPVEIAAPFLMTSPVLTDADLGILDARGDERLGRILAARRAPQAAPVLAPSPPTASRASSMPAVSPSVGSLEVPHARAVQDTFFFKPDAAETTSSAQREAADAAPAAKDIVAAPPMVPDLASPDPIKTPPSDHHAPAADSASRLRETLRRLAQPGRHQAAEVAEISTPGDLVQRAVRQDADGFYKGLAGLLEMTPPVLKRIELDERGERLAEALRSLGFGTVDALTILMMMKPRIGLDVHAFEAMTRYYGSLKMGGHGTVTETERAGASPSQPALQSSYQDAEGVRRVEHRPSFGRRRSLPDAAGKVTTSKR